MMKAQIRLLEAEQAFQGTKYDSVVNEASQLYGVGKFSACLEKLEELPTEAQLHKDLIEKLKGKSVYKTLKRLANGHGCGGITEAVATTSLLTHILLEIKAGNLEYRKLALSTLERVTDKVYGLGDGNG